MERRLEVSNLIHCVASLQRVAKLAPAHAVRGSPALQLVCERCARCLGGGGGGGGGDQSGDGVSGEEPCEPRHVSGALWASAKLDLASRPAGLALVRAALSRGVRTPAEWFKPMELSMAVWAVGKFGARLCAEPLARDFVWRLVRAIVESGGSGFDSQGFSNVVAGVASVGAPDDDPSVMAGLLACLKKHLGFFNPQEVSNTLHNLAKLNARLDAPGLAEAFACAVSTQRAHFTPQHLANVSWATAKLAEALEQGQQQPQQPLPQQPAASATSAAATSAEAADARPTFDFWALLAEDVRCRWKELNGQELSMCCWAAAQALGRSNPAARAVARLTRRLGKATRKAAKRGALSAQQLATIALSLVKLGCVDPKTLKRIARCSRFRAHEFNGQDLDNLASAYGRLAIEREGGWRAPKLVSAIASAGASVASQHSRCAARSLANLLLAVAKLAIQGKAQHDAGVCALADAAVCEIRSRVSEFNARDLANTAWGLALLGKADTRIMNEIASHAAPQLKTFNAMECSKLMDAMGFAGVRCAALDAAAAAQRELHFTFEGGGRAAAVGEVALRHLLGGSSHASADFRRREDTGAVAGNGSALWEDSYAFAEWLSRQPSPKETASPLLPAAWRGAASWSGFTCVELGAGLGLAAIVAQKMGMRVHATDGDESVLSLLRTNAAANASEGAAADANGGGGAVGGIGTGGGGTRAVTVHELKWGASDDPLGSLGLTRAPDLLVATGCVYGTSRDVWHALNTTLDKLSGPHTLVLLTHGIGAAPSVHHLRGDFYAQAASTFEAPARVAQHTLHAEHRGCQIHALVRKSQR